MTTLILLYDISENDKRRIVGKKTRLSYNLKSESIDRYSVLDLCLLEIFKACQGQLVNWLFSFRAIYNKYLNFV